MNDAVDLDREYVVAGDGRKRTAPAASTSGNAQQASSMQAALGTAGPGFSPSSKVQRLAQAGVTGAAAAPKAAAITSVAGSSSARGPAVEPAAVSGGMDDAAVAARVQNSTGDVPTFQGRDPPFRRGCHAVAADLWGRGAGPGTAENTSGQRLAVDAPSGALAASEVTELARTALWEAADLATLSDRDVTNTDPRFVRSGRSRRRCRKVCRGCKCVLCPHLALGAVGVAAWLA